MIAESGIFRTELMSKSAQDETVHTTGQRSREDVIDELLNFTWNGDGRMSFEAIDASISASGSGTGSASGSVSGSGFGSGGSLTCGQELSLSSTLEKSVKLQDPDELPHAQSLRAYSTSDLIDLGTVMKDFNETSTNSKQMLNLNSSSDVRIPEYELDVISEDYTPVALTRGLPVNGNGNDNQSGRSVHMVQSGNNMPQRPGMNLNMRPEFRSSAASTSNGLFTREKPEGQVFTPHKTLAQVSENETLKSELTPEQTLRAAQSQSNATATEAKAARRKRFLRRRSSERKPFENVPEFIKEELMTTSGIGHFTMSELMCCLLFAHREALSSNSYANIRAKMGNKRSRVSIRRKIEKIVLSETGLGGGLLGLTGDQNQLVLEAIWNRLMSLISDAETYGTQNLKLFAAQLREYAQNPLKFAVREQRR